VPVRKFSIVITCHNQAHLIRDAVNSSLQQLHSNKEVIVVDDASTDGSSKVLKSYDDTICFCPLKTNVGAARARNIGAALASGDYLAFLDGDDALQPWALTIYQRIVDSCEPKLILGNLLWFKEHLPAVSRSMPRQIEYVSYECWAYKDRSFRSSASALVVERVAFESVGGWPEEIALFEDQYLEAKLAYSGRAIQVVSPATVLYRLHESNITLDTRKLITGCYGFLTAFRASQLPFGWRRRLASSALIAGPAFWVLKRAYRAGLRSEASKLLVRAWPILSLAALTRCRYMLFGRRPVEVLPTAESAAG
jgi:glycosyltransferase involved in cell wall biosynthesis